MTADKIHTKKIGKHEIMIQNNKQGVSIWINGRWVMDASLFMEDLEITICTNRMKKIKGKWDDHLKFRYDRRCR